MKTILLLTIINLFKLCMLYNISCLIIVIWAYIGNPLKYEDRLSKFNWLYPKKLITYIILFELIIMFIFSNK